jgi:catechol 2,3-dioxygenase-like lactoylglutathione lyase family enzyme
MSTTEIRDGDVATSVGNVDMKLEVVIIPVSDVDRAKAFYDRLGWRLDADIARGDAFRIVQFTPPGSGCSVAFGMGIPTAAPGTTPGLELIVSDIEAAEIFHGSPFTPEGRISGPDPEHRSYLTYGAFADPDGNNWLLQEITTRLPGRIDPGQTRYGSVSDLAGALRRAEAAHGEHERRTGRPDPDWPGWYATYMVSEQSGEAPPQ